MTGQTRVDRHGEFIMRLGDRLLNRYTDGGPAVDRTQSKRRKAAAKRQRARARRAARPTSRKRDA